jgi:4-hydroxythreonine-4-phosphate dehydrogenase
MTLPRIGITLGDPGGIGPEIILKSFAGNRRLPRAHYILFAARRFLEREEKALGMALPLRARSGAQADTRGSLVVRDIPAPAGAGTRGSSNAESGSASFRYFEAAVAEARRGELDAIVTAPISKAAWSLAGARWKGHTEYLSRFYPGAIMAFWSEPLKVALVSHHVSLRAALKKIKREALRDFFLSLDRSLSGAGTSRFEFVVSGLNPHAGEQGLLGREEIDEIGPAVDDARRLGIRISGPFPPDVVFRNAVGRKDLFVIALYHDQGLIPFKLLAFETGVNVTLGLPFVRTSPDHGTAFDIAGQNRADHRSMVAAVRLAADLLPPRAPRS